MALETSSLGYAIIDCQHLSEELASAAKAEVNDRLSDFQGAASDDHGYGILGWGPQCAAFFGTQKEVRSKQNDKRMFEADLSDLQPSLHCEPNRRSSGIKFVHEGNRVLHQKYQTIVSGSSRIRSHIFIFALGKSTWPGRWSLQIGARFTSRESQQRRRAVGGGDSFISWSNIGR